MKRYVSMIAALAAVIVLSSCATDPPGGPWVTIFDGTPAGLENWNRLGDANWRIEDGAVVADKKKGKAQGFLVSKKSYGNFQLRVEFWVSHDANSGIFMRCKDPKKITDSLCYEANIFDQRADPVFGTGALTKFAHVDPIYKAGGKWNTYEITLNGPHLILVFNGVKTVDTMNKKFKSGPIGLQYGKGVVKFRKVEIRELQSEAS